MTARRSSTWKTFGLVAGVLAACTTTDASPDEAPRSRSKIGSDANKSRVAAHPQAPVASSQRIDKPGHPFEREPERPSRKLADIARKYEPAMEACRPLPEDLASNPLDELEFDRVFAFSYANPRLGGESGRSVNLKTGIWRTTKGARAVARSSCLRVAHGRPG